MEAKQILIRVPEELKEMLTNEARRRGINTNALIVTALWAFFENRG